MPKTNVEFWVEKKRLNASRDHKAELDLEGMGWRYLVLWECELRDREALTLRLKAFLDT